MSKNTDVPEWAHDGKTVYVVDSASFGIGSPAPRATAARVERAYRRYVIVEMPGGRMRRFNYRPAISDRPFLESGGSVYADWIVPENDERVKQWIKRRAVHDLMVAAKTAAKAFIYSPNVSTAYKMQEAVSVYVEAEEKLAAGE